MHRGKHLLIAFSLLVLNIPLQAQDSTRSLLTFGDGLTVQGGIGYLSTRDEYISAERYSGTAPYVAIGWSRLHETYGYRLLIQYAHISDLKNFGASADVTQFLLGLAFLYPIGKAEIFSREVSFLLGPTSELFMDSRHQVYSPFSGVTTYAALFSGGLRSEAFYPMSPGFQLRGALQATVLSLGMKSTRDPNGSKITSMKFVTPFGGFNASGELEVVHKLSDSFSAAVGYRFELASISAWDYFISAEDELIASISFNF